MDLLERSRRWCIDGTFRIALRIFSQVFLVLAEEHGRVHPVVYGLLPDTSRVTYDRFFYILLNLRVAFNQTVDYNVLYFTDREEFYIIN